MRNPIISKIAGDFVKEPRAGQLSQEAKQLIEEAYAGLPSDEVWDHHVHMLGLGRQNTGCWVNPKVRSVTHPYDHTQYQLILNASGIESIDRADEQYLQRVIKLLRNFPKPAKACILAVDKCYKQDGTVDEEHSKFYTPNDYVVQLARTYPDIFAPCISVHPYRLDALEELDKWGSQGVKMVKWMPSTMGMDPSDPQCVPFFEKMKQYNMVLLTHTGKEEIMPVAKFKPLNNPLLYRGALELGLKIVMAHCGSLGSNPDLDKNSGRMGGNMEFFLRLMSEKQYEGQLFGDISALTEIIRCNKPLLTVLQKKELQHRLINGSDYPLPAINSVISTELMVQLKYIRREQRAPLAEIYHSNPLLFDFVLKRTLRDPADRSNGLAASMFVRNPALGLDAPLAQASAAL